ncbi:hypothetical protein B0J14DRAFT_105678 [Halenospora varia]|nr:hypothetical protein B0J14DRAFT_105678 [Halenospora varia]
MVQLATSLIAALAALSSLTLAAPSNLEARAPVCSRPGIAWGNTQEAVTCINQLAALGSTCVTDYAGRSLRRCGSTEIWSISRTSKGASTPCQNVARSAGLIMDACNQPDNRISGWAYAQGNGDFYIEIRGA